jgi:hypothetical protein
MSLRGVANQSWVEGSFEVGTRTMLDNPMPSAKVARRHAKVKLRKEILPNPSGGVNTHLWDNEAYIVGIVHVVRPDYSVKKNNEGNGLACWV